MAQGTLRGLSLGPGAEETGPQAARRNSLQKRVDELEAEVARLEKQLATAETILEVQGSQYTSLAFGERCRKARIVQSMGSVGDAYDNAMWESFFATLECELLDRRRFATVTEARREVFGFIEGFYNTRRLHSVLGYASPANFEKLNHAA